MTEAMWAVITGQYLGTQRLAISLGFVKVESVVCVQLVDVKVKDVNQVEANRPLSY